MLITIGKMLLTLQKLYVKIHFYKKKEKDNKDRISCFNDPNYSNVNF